MSNSYTDIFTGSPVQPSDVSYVSYTLSAANPNINLSWPTTGLETTNVVARKINVTVSDNAATYTLTFPDATTESVGMDVLFYNFSSYDFNVLDADGGVICTVNPADQEADPPTSGTVHITLTDNTTTAGSWITVDFGALTGAIQATALAGKGLEAISNTLNVDMQTVPISTNYTVTSADRGKLIVWTAGNGDITLPTSASVGNGFIVSFNNASEVGGEVNLVPTGGNDIDTFTSNYPISVLESLSLVADGVNSYHSLGFGKETIFAVNILDLDLGGRGSSYTLSDIEASKLIINFTGTLTENITVFFPQTANQYYIANNSDPTVSNYTVTIETNGGSLPYIIPEGQRFIYYCDGSELFPIPTTVPPGGLTLPDGDAANPSLYFDGDADTGIYLADVGEFGISAGGVASGIFSTTGLEIAINGTAANPSITWSSEPTSGLFLTVGTNVGISFSGAAVAIFDNTGIETASGTSSAPSFSFISDDDSGMYRVAENTLGWSIGGNLGMSLNSSNLKLFNGTDLVFEETGGSNTITLSAGVLSADSAYTLPLTTPSTDGQVLSSTMAGVMSWVDPLAPTGPLVLPDGTLGTPSLVFTGSLTTGFYQPAPDQINVAIAGNPILAFEAGGISMLDATEIAFFDSTSTNYTALKGGEVGSNTTYTLPLDYPTVSGQPLVSTDAGVMSWATSSFGADSITIPNGATSMTHQAPAAPTLNYVYVWPSTTPNPTDKLVVASVVANVITFTWGP